MIVVSLAIALLPLRSIDKKKRGKESGMRNDLVTRDIDRSEGNECSERLISCWHLHTKGPKGVVRFLGGQKRGKLISQMRYHGIDFHQEKDL